jgi:hypothetical protein
VYITSRGDKISGFRPVTFLIADTFTDSLARLTGDEQKAAKTTAFDLQMDPSAPGLNFHKLERGKDRRFWSVRVNADVRLIVHRTDNSLLLCYVDHHDKAYAWAERRKLETHPTTGAAQIIELREAVREIVVPRYVQEDVGPAKQEPVKQGAKNAGDARPLVAIADEQLLGYGVPAEWLRDVRNATEDELLKDRWWDVRYGERSDDKISCGNLGALVTAPDRFLLTYSDFRHRNARDEQCKAVNVQEFVVTPAK